MIRSPLSSGRATAYTFDRSSLLFGIEPDPHVMPGNGSPFFSPPTPVNTVGSPSLLASQGGEASSSKASGSAPKDWTVVPSGSCTAPPGPKMVSQSGAG